LYYENILSPGRVSAAGGWQAVFGNDHPLNFEIGIGGGEFLLALAAERPGENFVGLDLAAPFLRKAARVATRERRENVRFLIHDAKAALTEIFDRESLAAVYVNFPDPWPKKGHEKRRHFDPFFTSLIEDRLAVGGTLYLATDVAEYAEQAHAALAASEVLVNAYPAPWLNDRRWQHLHTRYEKKWLEAGKELFYLAFRKERALAAPRYPMRLVALAPFEVPVTPAAAAELLRRRIDDEGGFVVKTLSVKPYGDAQLIRLLLVDRATGFKTYLHTRWDAAPAGATVTLENAADAVVTDAKKVALLASLAKLA
jgi:tRNA (guanine-N7-)-methyltransferase